MIDIDNENDNRPEQAAVPSPHAALLLITSHCSLQSPPNAVNFRFYDN